jgi:hypothetical protein
MAAFLFLGMQSLSDVAREEAERRRLLDQQGVEAKVIERDSGQRAADKDLTQKKVPSPIPVKVYVSSNKNKDRGSARNYRNALQKLDRAILREEGRLEVKRERLQSMRGSPPRISTSRLDRNQTSNNITRLQSDIEDMEEKLNQLRQERADKYEEGLKAGFLPGELDGKGVMP